MCIKIASCGVNLNLDQGKTADEEYKLAKALIAETGYHLRDAALEGCLNRIERI
jgi:hypothetical protein